MRPTASRAAPEAMVDADSFESFYRGQVDIVYRALALTLGDSELAREAADEAMLRAYVRWSAVCGYDNPGGWVYRVGLNWATSQWRRTRRERPLSYLDQGSPTARSGQPGLGAVAAVSALARLTLNHRAVVVARILLDLSTAETAAALDIPTNTVKSRLARALQILRTALTIGDDDELR